MNVDSYTSARDLQTVDFFKFQISNFKSSLSLRSDFGQAPQVTRLNHQAPLPAISRSRRDAEEGLSDFEILNFFQILKFEIFTIFKILNFYHFQRFILNFNPILNAPY